MSFCVSSVVVELFNVDGTGSPVTHEMEGVVVGHFPEEVFVHVAETMPLAWKDEHIESLVCAYECINDADGVGRIDIVVDIAMDQQQMTFQAGCNFLIRVDMVNEGSIALRDLLLDSMVLL